MHYHGIILSISVKGTRSKQITYTGASRAHGPSGSSEARLDISELDCLVHFYFKEGLAPSTRRTYEAGKKKFNQFCRDTNFAMQGTVNQNTLCYFVAYLAKHNLSPATIKVYLSALRYHHIANDLPKPNRLNIPKLRILSNGVTKVAAKTLSQKTARLPITPDILRRVYKLWLPRRFEYETIMMWAASTLCFFGFFRMGELTIANNTAFDQSVHLTPADVAVDSHTNPTMLQVHLKTSKLTDSAWASLLPSKRRTMNYALSVLYWPIWPNAVHHRVHYSQQAKDSH